MKIFASNLLTKREEKRYTQAYVAVLCNMSQPNYSDIERGKTSPSVSQLRKFSEIFETTIDELINEKKEKKESIQSIEKILTPSEILVTSDTRDIYIKTLENCLRILLEKKG